MTALHVAVRSSNATMVRYLLANGARTDIKDGSGRTPLDVVNGARALQPAIFAEAEGLTPRTAEPTTSAAALASNAIATAPLPPPAGGRGGAGAGGGARGGNPAAVQEVRAILEEAAKKQ